MKRIKGRHRLIQRLKDKIHSAQGQAASAGRERTTAQKEWGRLEAERRALAERCIAQQDLIDEMRIEIARLRAEKR